MTLVQALKNEAFRLGFDLAGITTPAPPPHLSVYEGWVAAGRHGEMGYMATDRARSCRADARSLLPGCRSILVLGARYPAGSLATPRNENAASGSVASGSATVASAALGSAAGTIASGSIAPGKVAAYACGPDYHDIFPPRLLALAAFLETQVGHPVPHRAYTDTGPLLERDLAQRAGLGWIGKNTCLIAPGLGSYFLLAEILLDLDLEPDPPFLADRCGSCTRCLAACPTACILPDRTIDARRCISYLTIELKSAIPPGLRPLMGGWIFGCDVCQQVCPWNRFAAPTAPGLVPDVRAEMALTPAEFNRRFRGTPLRRAKRRGYLRNAAVALGSSQDPAAVPALALALQHDPEPLVRGHAAWALGQIGGETALKVLRAGSEIESDGSVLEEISAALENNRVA
jgi:epoxyqueuosine reductase